MQLNLPGFGLGITGLALAAAAVTPAYAQVTPADPVTTPTSAPEPAQSAPPLPADSDVEFDALFAIDPAQPLPDLPGFAVDWPEQDDIPIWPGEFAPEDRIVAEGAAPVDPETAIAIRADDERDGLIDRASADKQDAQQAETQALALPGNQGEQRSEEERAERRANRQAVRELSNEDIRYSVNLRFVSPEDLKGIDDKIFIDRFNSVSTLVRLDDDAANLAQINRRARDDRDFIDQLLRIYGYYDGSIEQSVVRVADENRVTLTYDVVPGPLYSLTSVDLPGLEAAGKDTEMLRSAFGVTVGDPVNSDAIMAGGLSLATAMLENGYAFASLGEPSLLIDHAARGGALEQPVAPAGKYRFGKVTISSDKRLFGARHLERIARFDAGDIYQQSDIDDLRRAIIATGLVSTVKVVPVAATPPQGDEPGVVDVAVEAIAAPFRTIAGELGYGTGEGFRSEISWEHRNFFPPEGLVRARGVAGTQEQLINFVYRRNNFRSRDQVLTTQLLASNIDRAAFAARTLLIAGSVERQTNLIFQKKWTWSLGGELVLSDELDSITRAAGGDRSIYYIGALPTSLNYDGSNDLLDPTKGFRVGVRFSPEVSFQSGTNAYLRTQIDGSYYQPVSDTIVLAARARFASIAGAPLFDIAPSRRLYAGGGGSVRGYGFQRIGPRNPLDRPIGGRGLAEFSLEARVRFGNFGVVPFVDAGNVTNDVVPTFDNIRFGAGIGLRYYSTFGPLRLDIGTPLNRQPGDSRIGIYISLGQAF